MTVELLSGSCASVFAAYFSSFIASISWAAFAFYISCDTNANVAVAELISPLVVIWQVHYGVFMLLIYSVILIIQHVGDEEHLCAL